MPLPETVNKNLLPTKTRK